MLAVVASRGPVVVVQHEASLVSRNCIDQGVAEWPLTLRMCLTVPRNTTANAAVIDPSEMPIAVRKPVGR